MCWGEWDWPGMCSGVHGAPAGRAACSAEQLMALIVVQESVPARGLGGFLGKPRVSSFTHGTSRSQGDDWGVSVPHPEAGQGSLRRQRSGVVSFLLAQAWSGTSARGLRQTALGLNSTEPPVSCVSLGRSLASLPVFSSANGNNTPLPSLSEK